MHMTIEHEAHELKERMDKGDKFMTTSCCPSYVKLVEKHLPELAPNVSKAGSPMHYTAEYLKSEHPDCITVFIGPCVGKRYESRMDPYVDYMMNFEEFNAFITARGINLTTAHKEEWDINVTNASRGFAISGGVVNALRKHVSGALTINDVTVDGINPENLKVLKSIAKGNCDGNFVEIMACEGGCVAGPATIANPKTAARQVKDFCK